MKLSDVFFKPKILQQDDNYDSFSRGMSTQNIQKADKNYDVEVKEFLLKHLRKYGDDIRSIDLQRGRDHGIGSYESLRQYCGKPASTKWSDWQDTMSETVKKNYQGVDHEINNLIFFLFNFLKK